MRNMQKCERLQTDQRAISPLIATLILILVAIVGGGMVYAVFRAQAGALARTADIQVQSIDVIAAGGVNVASVTVQNTGTAMLATVKVTIKGENGTADVVLTMANVEPGQTRSAGNLDVDAGTWKSGNTYAVSIVAEDADNNALISRSMTVLARS